MKTIRIFISSPGDVANERQICGKVIERIQGRYWSLIRIEDVFWENEAVRATATFQDEIDDPAECEIVIGIIWTKMGSPLPERFTRLDGRSHAPGTEWEIGRAITAYEEKVANGGDPKTTTPHVVVYRRRDKRAPLDDQAEEDKAAAREREVHEFFDKEFHNDDHAHTFKRASISYRGTQDFEEKLLRQLARLVLQQIPVLKSAFNLPPIGGSPFKGLKSFDFIDNDRFFGRTREIREAQRRLISSARKSIPFLLIYGGSGYGKSSLMRAGLAPVITRPGGSLDVIQGWRRVPFQPAKGSGTLCERLARALLLPPTEEEAHLSRELKHWPLTGLPELVENTSQGSPWDSASLARHFTDDDQRIFAIAAITETLEKLNRHLFLEIDQLEEIFTTTDIAEPKEKSPTTNTNQQKKQIAAFFATLGALAQTGRVWIVATMRSEFFPRVAETPGLFALVGKDRGYILPPPDRQSLREIIRYPALAARLEFERRDKEMTLSVRKDGEEIIEEKAKHDYLHDQILADAEDSPDALPLLEFVLQQLYDERDKSKDLLTWASYVNANGLKGAIANRATDVYGKLSPIAQEARHPIFAALIHIDSAKGTITRQRAPLISLKNHSGSDDFLDAFLNVHLLVTDEDPLINEPVVTLAHEALISHWDELSQWIVDHRGDLLARQRLKEQADLWTLNMQKKSYLLNEARLAEAERVVEAGIFVLSASESSYLLQSKKRAQSKRRLLNTAVAVFAIIASAAGFFAWRSKVETSRAERQTQRAEGALQDAQQKLERSWLEEGRSWLERARAAKEKGENFAALLFAARAVGFEGYGRRDEPLESSKIKETYPLLLGQVFKVDPDLERERKQEVAEITNFIGSVDPTLLPLWSSPVSAHHHGQITNVAFSKDGTRIASAASDNTIKLWKSATGKELNILRGQPEQVTCTAFSPDCSRVAIGLGDKTLKIWDTKIGKELDTLSGHTEQVTSVVFSPDGNSIASGSGDKLLKIWDTATGKELKTLSGHTEQVTSVVFSPDGSRIASGSGDKLLKIWDTATGKELKTLSGHTEQVTSVVFSPDGSSIASGSGDKLLKIWDAATGKELKTLSGHTDQINSVAFSPDGNRIASGSEFGSLKLWDVQTGKDIVNLIGHHRGVLSVVFSPNGQQIASGSRDQTLKLWDSITGKEITSTTGHTSWVTSVDFSPDGVCIASGSEDGTIKLWDTTSGTELATLKGHSAAVKCVAYSPDGQKVASGSSDGTLKLWDASNGELIETIEGNGEEVSSVSFSPDGSEIAFSVVSSSGGSSVKLWSVMTRAEPKTFTGNDGRVTCVIFSPDGKKIAAGSRDILDDSYGTITIWAVSSGVDPAIFEVPSGGVTSVTFSPDGSRLISADSHGLKTSLGTIRVWSIDTGKEIPSFERHSAEYVCAETSPDGMCIIAGMGEGSIEILDASSGKRIATVRGHSDSIRDIAISPDGSRIASGSIDGMVKIWDFSIQGKPKTLVKSAGDIIGVAISPDGKRVASAESGGAVRITDIATGNDLVTYRKQRGEVASLAFHPDGFSIASGWRDGAVRILEVASGKNIATLEGHTDWVKCVAFSLDGTRLATASNDKTVKIWDVHRRLELASLPHRNWVSCVAYNQDGSRLVTADYRPGGMFGSGEEGNIKIWDTTTKKEIASHLNNLGGVTSIALSPDGERIVFSDKNETIRILDTISGREINSLRGHSDRVTGVRLSPDGSRIVSGSDDKTIKLWDTNSGKEIAALKGHSGAIRGVAFSPDGSIIISGSSDKTIKLWNTYTAVELTCPPDLLHLQREGLFQLKGRELIWGKNQSLFSSTSFTPIRSRSDLKSDMVIAANSLGMHTGHRMQLLANLGQWQAAIPLWTNLKSTDFARTQQIELRRCYLYLLLTGSRPLVNLSQQHSIEPLLAEIASLLDKETLDDSWTYLAGVTFIEELASIGHPAFETMVKRFTPNASESQIEAIAGAVFMGYQSQGLRAGNKSRFATILQEFYINNPKSSSLLRSYLATVSPTSSEWRPLVEKLLALPDASATEFADAAYAASQHLSMKGTAKELIVRSSSRFPHDLGVQYMIGWSYLNLHEPNAAYVAFEKARYLHFDEKPSISFLVAYALSARLADHNSIAIAAYKNLIDAGRLGEPSVDWGDQRTVRSLGWTETLTTPLEDLRVITLQKYPELKKISSGNE